MPSTQPCDSEEAKANAAQMAAAPNSRNHRNHRNHRNRQNRHGLGGSPKFLGVHQNHHELLEQPGTARTTVAAGPPRSPSLPAWPAPTSIARGGRSRLLRWKIPKEQDWFLRGWPRMGKVSSTLRKSPGKTGQNRACCANAASRRTPGRLMFDKTSTR